jgi:hypothetical protein
MLITHERLAHRLLIIDHEDGDRGHGFRFAFMALIAAARPGRPFVVCSLPSLCHHLAVKLSSICG